MQCILTSAGESFPVSGQNGRRALVSPVLGLLLLLVASSGCSRTHNEPSAQRPRSGTPAPAASRPVFPFSVVPGGVRNASELMVARAADPVVRSHYSDLGSGLAAQTMPQDEWLYTSYRMGSAIYWTRHTVRVRRGEIVLTDGVHMIRARCGNRLSSTPKQPVRFVDPPSVLNGTPVELAEYEAPDLSPYGVSGADAPALPLDFPSQSPDAGVNHPGPEPAGKTDDAAPKVLRTGTSLPLPHVTGVPAITAPEPGTWIMLLSGFGFIGIAARRRR